MSDKKKDSDVFLYHATLFVSLIIQSLSLKFDNELLVFYCITEFHERKRLKGRTRSSWLKSEPV